MSTEELEKSFKLLFWSKLLGEEWTLKLQNVLNQDYMNSLGLYISNLRKKTKVYPPQEEVFNFLKNKKLNDIDLVILIKSPNFTNNKDLINLVDSIEEYCYNGLNLNKLDLIEIISNNPNILILPNVFTYDKDNIHENVGWETFTDNVISLLNELDQNICFLSTSVDLNYKLDNLNKKHLIKVLDGTDIFKDISNFNKRLTW